MSDRPRQFNYTVAQAMEAISCSRSFLYKLIREGCLDARKQGRVTVITGTSLVAYAEGLPSANIGKAA